MTSPAPTVRLSDLVLGAELGKGGQGVVRSVRSVRGRPAGLASAVYKEYLPAVLPSLRSGVLQSMVDLPGVPDDDARWLREHAAWPDALVTHQGAATGFLMRKVPERFRFDYRGLSPVGSERKPANFEFLLNSDDYVARIGLKITPRDRLALLRELARTLERMHRLGIAVGDLSPRNVLFATGPTATCFFLDCDAMRFRGDSAMPQLETPEWQGHDGEEKATPHSDALKFGLMAIRLIARDQSATDPGVLSSIDPELAALATGSQSRPDARPTPGEWLPALERALVNASTKPAAPSPRPPSPPPPRPAPPTRPHTARPGPVGPGPVRPGGAPAPAPTPPTTVPPVPPPKRGKAVGWLLAIVVAAALLFGSSDGDSTPRSDPAPQPPVSHFVVPEPPPIVPPASVLPTRPAPDPPSPTVESPTVESPTAPPPDPIRTARAGQCFGADGSGQDVRLEPADCGNGVFKVLRVFEGTTDRSRCDDIPADTWNFSYPGYNLVLCLSYQYEHGDAYYARPGQCVYGEPGTSWVQLSCQTGAFTVLARHQGPADANFCGAAPSAQKVMQFPVPRWDSQSVTLCLEMRYPDDLGRAVVNQCLAQTGPANHATFTKAPCDRANVIVVGRTSTYNAPGFCGRYGWGTWSPKTYTDLAYTVCYRNL
ncbi:hypothetical protein ACFYS8_06265 [Kitasatospora sp. NPDC004615]|uniref:LppU/SCO3897 family protein n=1 Tax=Kitasatospora sp. NPDC004615 TaxID=3364017 RepID=UPI0036C84161